MNIGNYISIVAIVVCFFNGGLATIKENNSDFSKSELFILGFIKSLKYEILFYILSVLIILFYFF